MTGSSLAARILRSLHRTLGSRWEITADGTRILVQHADRGTPYHPPQRHLAWNDLIARIEDGFAAQGVQRDRCLPLRWGRDTDLTISAVQALDPLLKDGRLLTYRQGFIPQPVVRFTGARDAHGDLRDGFLTSFVNVSRVEPITDVADYVDALDGWLSILSRLGLHARHITVSGDLREWRRGEVSGITLKFHHLDDELGDIVLLWNTRHPERPAIDLGSGLERIAWVRSRSRWGELVHGRYADCAPSAALDALRTATLLLGHGIISTARGTGAAVHRSLAAIPGDLAPLGFSAIVRSYHWFWSIVTSLPAGWPEVTHLIEGAVSARRSGTCPGM